MSLRDDARATLPALALLASAVAGAALVREWYPSVPAAAIFGGAAAVASIALLLPSFRRVAFVDLLFEHDVFFVTGVVVALVWVHAAPESYHHTTAPLRFAVNDVLMTLFFAIAAKEVFESTLPGGPLSSARTAAMPLAATAGGMLGPAALFVGGAFLLGRGDLVRGWAIPTATDIAFCSLLARRIFGAGHPAIPFLLLLAIADDAAGLAILAVAYPQGPLKPLVLVAGVALAMVVALLLGRLLGIRSPVTYLIACGPLSWWAFHHGGLHPALALVPIVTVLPHGARDLGLYATEQDGGTNTLERLERMLAPPVALILGLFGLVNAGVELRGAGAATLLVAVALVLGKPTGIVLAVAAGRRLGLAMPEGMGLRDVVVLGSAAGIGFTVALFVATVAFPEGSDQEAAKMGALGSVAAAPIAWGLARALRIEVRR